MGSSVEAVNLQKADREKKGAALSSVIAAIFLTSMKIVIGLLTGSLGILSEAAHSGLDLVAAAITYLAVRISGKPADPEHTYGHGKIENLSALFETVLLLATCVWIIYEAILRLFFKHVDVESSIWSFVVMGISIVIDFSRSRYLLKMAKKHESQALEADALHFSTDIWSSTVVIVGLGLVAIANWLRLEWLAKADAVAAFGVALIVIFISLQLGKRTIADLMDSISPGVRDDLVRAVHVEGVQEVRQVRVRSSGPNVFADVNVTVSDDLPYEQAQHISQKIEAAVRTILPRADVVVGITPVETGDKGILDQVRRLAGLRGVKVHAIRLYKEGPERSLEMHLEVNEALTLGEAHNQADDFEAALRQTLPEIMRVITHLEPSGDISATVQTTTEDQADLAQTLLGMLSDMQVETGVSFRVQDIRAVRGNQGINVSFTIPMASDMNMIDAHLLTEKVENYLRARRLEINRVVIHVEPIQEG